MSGWLVDIGLVLVLVLIGGFFAASEIALVSLRESQVANLSEHGRRGRALGKLHADPNRFLAAVQVGVTLAGFLSAAVGGSALGDRVAPILVDLGVSERLASILAVVGITIQISNVSQVHGALLPKRLGLPPPQANSQFVAPTIDRLAWLFRPVIWFLSVSTNGVMRLLGGDPQAGREEMSEEEVRGLLATHTGFTAEERRIVAEVFVAGDKRLREVMVPRTEVAFLDANMQVSTAITQIAEQPHSRYPVVRDGVDDVTGFIHVRDLMNPHLTGRRMRLGELARPLMMLPGTKEVLPAMSEMRRAGAHMAIVVDEYGGTAGIVTLEDLVEELVGDIRDEYDTTADSTKALGGGDVEVDGLLNLDDFQDETGIELPDGPYETAGGYLMSVLGRVPVVGDVVEVGDRRLEVLAMDGRRVERLKVTASPAANAPWEDAAHGE